MSNEKFLIMTDSVKALQEAMLKNLHYDVNSSLTQVQYAIGAAWQKMSTAERDATITAVIDIFKKVKKGESVWVQEFIPF